MENKFCSCYFSFISSIIEQILKITQNYPIISKTASSDAPFCIFRKNCASVPEERSAVPLQTEQSSTGLLVTIIYSAIPARKFKTICLGGHSA